MATIKSDTSSFWKLLLSDFTTSTKLWLEGFEMPSTPHKNDLHDSHYLYEKLAIPIELLASLKLYAKKNRVTLSYLYHSAFGILLNRFSGTDLMLYGTSHAISKKDGGKHIHVADPLFAVKSSTKKETSLKKYCHDLQAQLKDSQKHAHKFIEESSHEVFNYILIDHGIKSQKPKKKKISQSRPDQFHLIMVLNTKNSAKFEIHYQNKIFSNESIKRFSAHYILILQEIVRNDKQSVVEFNILTSSERKTILHEWNSPKSTNETPMEQCVHELFAAWAHKAPTSPAVTYGNTTFSYQEIDQYANQLARLLLAKQVKMGDHIAVFMERSPSIIITMLAIFKIGAVYIPLNPKYPDDKIQFLLEDSQPKVVLAHSTERIPEKFINHLCIIDEKLTELDGENNTPINIKISPDENAYIIYTSGTTGLPKGVIIKHISLINLTAFYQDKFNITAKDRASQFASQGFDSYFCETIPFLALGGCVCIIDDNTKLTPSVFMGWLAQQQISICDLPTAYAQILFSMPWPADLQLRIMKIGGESITHYPTQVYTFDIWNGYGPTETAVEATFMKIYQANTTPENQPCQHMPPPIGKPITNAEVYIVDMNNQPVPIGIAGELLIGGLGLSVGYLNRKDLTDQKFIPNPFSQNKKSKLYRTGDLVRWLSNGDLEYLGRLDNQVKIRGYRIEISEIETTLTQYPDVSEVVVITKETMTGHKTLIAYLVPDLDRIRIPYQEKCLITVNDIRFHEVITEDISKHGIAITGVTDKLPYEETLRIHLKLPGMSDGTWFTGRLIWDQGQRAGIQFDATVDQISLTHKSIEYFLSTHNLMEVLESSAAKRSLRKALKKTLPEYMVPSVFSVLTKFPLTFNGKVDVKALPPPKDIHRLLERNYITPNTDTEKAIATMWTELLHKPQISLNDSFFDLGGNSLLVSQLSLKIMQRFNISIPSKIFFDLPYISVLAEYIDSHGKKYNSQSTIQQDIAHDLILPEDILPSKKLNPFIKMPRGILLTGAGGFLGIYLLKELLAKTDAKIYCLIRKGGFDSAAKHLIHTIEKFNLDDSISLNDRRIIIITSDISHDKFGIPSEQYNSLAEKIDTIYHCGAQVNTMASYTNLRNSNVHGTMEIIKFATQHINKTIHYISTLSSAYRMNVNGEYSEDFPDKENPNLVGGYALSKWVSERLITEAKNRGLPVCIYRSGYIMGQSDTGLTNTNDALLLLIKGCIQLGFAPRWDEKICILPVDFVSKAIVSISLAQPGKSDVFHVDNPHGIMWTDLIAWLNSYGYSIKLCEHTEWLKKLQTITYENAIYPFLPNYLANEKHQPTPDTNVDKASAILKSIQLDYPEVNDQLLTVYINYLLRIGFLPTPSALSSSKIS